MDFSVFESRVIELMFKTDARIIPPLVAYRVGCSVELARRFLEEMARQGTVTMEVDEKGLVFFDMPGRPAPTNEPLSWLAASPPAVAAPATPEPMGIMPYGAPLAAYPPQGPYPLQVQIHNAPPPAPRVVVVGQQKSVAVAILAALVLGPLGMLYSTVGGAIVMFFVNVLMFGATAGMGLVVTVPIGAVWAAAAASAHNDRLTARIG
jgi:hypothetical protein